MTALPDDARRIVANAASLEGLLRFGGSYSSWLDLAHCDSLPREAGVYLLGLKLGLKYCLAISRIIYVGSSANLHDRLKIYSKGSHNAEVDLLRHIYPNGLLVTFTALPGISRAGLQAVEDALLQEARRILGSYPICNRGRIDSPYAESLSSVVRIYPCDGLLAPRTIEMLGEQLGSKSLGKLAEPKPAGYWKDKSSRSGPLQIVFTSKPVSESSAPQPLPSHQPDIESLSWTTAEHLGMWDAPKMRKSPTFVPRCLR